MQALPGGVVAGGVLVGLEEDTGFVLVARVEVNRVEERTELDARRLTGLDVG